MFHIQITIWHSKHNKHILIIPLCLSNRPSKSSGQDLSWRWDRGAGRDGYGAASWGQGPGAPGGNVGIKKDGEHWRFPMLRIVTIYIWLPIIRMNHESKKMNLLGSSSSGYSFFHGWIPFPHHWSKKIPRYFCQFPTMSSYKVVGACVAATAAGAANAPALSWLPVWWPGKRWQWWQWSSDPDLPSGYD